MDTKSETEKTLPEEVAHLTHELKRQRRMWTKFIGGIATGVGTVMGATLIAGAILVIVYPILHFLGFPIPLPGSAPTSTSATAAATPTPTVATTTTP